MAVNALVDVRLEWGRKLVKHLEAAGIDLDVAFWAKLEEYGDWRFFIASPGLDKVTLFEAYSHVADAGLADSVYNEPIVVILRMDQGLVTGLRSQFRGIDECNGQYIDQVGFGERFIEEGLLLRVR